MTPTTYYVMFGSLIKIVYLTKLGFSMKNMSHMAKSFVLIKVILFTLSISAQETTNLCSQYTSKTVNLLEYTTNQAKHVVHDNKSLIKKGDQLGNKITTMVNSEEAKKIFTKEKLATVKQIANDHYVTIKAQVDTLLRDGIDPELRLMQARIEDLFKEDQEKIKDLTNRVKTTINDLGKDEKVKASLKSIKAEGKKLEAHFKKLFK